jgi:hypothetical protein
MTKYVNILLLLLDHLQLFIKIVVQKILNCTFLLKLCRIVLEYDNIRKNILHTY